MIYFDNASTSFPKPPQVSRAVAEAIETLGAPHRGAYDIALDASRALYRCRKAVANFFHTEDAASVVFTSGATEALNTAINGLLTAEDHVITTAAEHNSVLRPLYRLGCGLSILPCEADGRVATNRIREFLTPATKAVVCHHMSNVTGYAVDMVFLSRFCRENGLYLIMDCAQSAGRIPVNASLADVVCFTGHKSLFGPQGTGGMIINNAPVKPLKTGGTGHRSHEREHPGELPDRLEAGTLNGHGLAGLLEGIHFINKIGIGHIIEKENTLTQRFINGIAMIDNIKWYGKDIISLSVAGYDSTDVSALLAERGIATRPGLHCAPLIHEALHTTHSGLVRFSFSYFNTEEGVDITVRTLKTLFH